jgi:hypothetical protein
MGTRLSTIKDIMVFLSTAILMLSVHIQFVLDVEQGFNVVVIHTSIVIVVLLHHIYPKADGLDLILAPAWIL